MSAILIAMTFAIACAVAGEPDTRPITLRHAGCEQETGAKIVEMKGTFP